MPRGQQPYPADEQYDEAPAPKAKRRGRQPGSGGGAWKIVLQFVIGLAVIAGVAAAIVALYIKYYQ
jgi:hypothetical protein